MSEQWTDEQIDAMRKWYGRWDQRRFDIWLSAVIARAKREERFGARTLYVVQEWIEADGIHDGWNTAYGSFTNSRADAEGTLEYLRKTHRDTVFRLVVATRSDWKEVEVGEHD